jgi:uncharacterized protein YjbJ (UPF0337 family)
MNRDHIEGGVRNIRGRAKTAAGAVLGRPSPQVEGAIDQVAGAAQVAYGRARDTADDLIRDGRHLAHEARDRVHDVRGQAQDLYDEADRRGRKAYAEIGERGRHYRRRAEHHGRALAARADDNRLATLALVGAVAFGLGMLMRRDH